MIFAAAILTLPENMARLLAFAVQLGHTFGASSWLFRHGVVGWVGLVFLLVSSRIILDWTWKRYAMLNQSPSAKRG
jgi:hypothetical protein